MSDRTPQQTIDLARSLARTFYQRMGYVVPVGYKFDEAHHPHEVRCWQMACDAFEMIEGTELAEVFNELEEA
jgi:hypothetical protein